MVDTLVPADDGSAEIALRKALTARYNTVRPFLALLGESPALAAAQGGRQILAAVRILPGLARRKGASKSHAAKAPRSSSTSWSRAAMNRAGMSVG